MLDPDTALDRLAGIGLCDWADALTDSIRACCHESAHGNLRMWRAALDGLPDVKKSKPSLDSVAVGAPDIVFTASELDRARDALLSLAPWRKGPFQIGPIHIDAEWQSQLKWDRVAPAVSPLTDRLVLDVGCGNGYYALRMLGCGARAVVGVDPTLLYAAQFDAVRHFIEPIDAIVLPLRLHDLPTGSDPFDTVFSMGVLYHQRAPIDHLRQLRALLRAGGELVIETLVLPGSDPRSQTPPDRYARMRNVWHLPTTAELLVWLARAGLVDPVIVDVTATTTSEQRATDWMSFESLADALDPKDSTRTVEGWPAPLRAVVICQNR